MPWKYHFSLNLFFARPLVVWEGYFLLFCCLGNRWQNFVSLAFYFYFFPSEPIHLIELFNL